MKIQQLLTKESKWCKGALARDKNGKSINCLDVKTYAGGKEIDFGKNAVAWSLPGAISICYSQDDHENICDKIHAAMRGLRIKHEYISQFNDAENTTFDQVKWVIEDAEV